MQVSIFFNNKIPLAGIFPLEIFRSFIRNIEIFLMALFTRSIPPTSWDFRKLHQEHWYFPPLILHKIHLPPTFSIFSEDLLGTFRSSSNYLESLTLNFLESSSQDPSPSALASCHINEMSRVIWLMLEIYIFSDSNVNTRSTKLIMLKILSQFGSLYESWICTVENYCETLISIWWPLSNSPANMFLYFKNLQMYVHWTHKQ